MKDNARKYILKTSEIISCGIGTHYKDITCCSLLDSFSVCGFVCNCNCCGCSCISTNYPEITTNQLSSLSKVGFDKRVIDFLDNYQIEDETTKDCLFNEASYYNPAYYDVHDLLNENFIVYKIFDNGVRIINAGQANGILQYRVTGSTYDSGWQNSPTFLGLHYNRTYVFEIRDFYNNTEVFKYSKLVSLNYILESTTTTLPTKTIKILQTGTYIAGNTCSKYGCIKLTPPLVVGETVSINILANAITSGNGGASYVYFCCNSSLTPFCTISSYQLEKAGLLTFSYGTTLKYKVQTVSGPYNSQTIANFCLVSGNGCGTFVPLIDPTSCSTNLSVYVPPLDIIVGLGTPTTKISTVTDCVVCGSFTASPAIPSGECVDINLLGINATQGGTTTTYIICQSSGSAQEIPIFTLNTSPTFPTVTMRSGDIMKYCMLLNAPTAGYCSCAILQINGVDGSMGINPSITTGTGSCCVGCTCCIGSSYCISEEIKIASLSTSIALCAAAGNTNCECGNITITPALNYSTEYVTINYNLTQASVWGGSSTLKLNCKPKGGANYVQKILHTTNSTNGQNNANTFSGSFVINQGDLMTYCTNVFGNNGSCSDFCITSVVGGIGVIPTINLAKCESCRCLHITPISKVVSLCGVCGGVGHESGCFYITPSMTNICQSIDIHFSLTEVAIDGTNSVIICCKPNGVCCVPIPICTYTITVLCGLCGNNFNGCVRMCCGDTLYYCMCANGHAGSCNDLCICQLTSSPDIIPTISATCGRKCCVK
jgi:hypothetical protein